MSYTISDDLDNAEEFASNKGLANLREWVEVQDIDTYLAVAQFFEYGWQNRMEAFCTELEDAIQKHTTAPNVKDHALALLTFAKGEGAIVLSQGWVGGGGFPDDDPEDDDDD